METLQEFKCPACGGALEFDSAEQKMKCPYCESEYSAEEFGADKAEGGKEKGDDMRWQTSAGGEWKAGEEDGLYTYTCKSCGGEIVGDETTAATSCPFCGNPVVMTAQLSGMLKPDIIIPFKLNKNDAKNAYRNHIKGKHLLPDNFKDENHIDEIKAVYVPFWLFDAHADADVVYDATKVRMWSDSDYDYTETSFYKVYRDGSTDFTSVPVDGSEKMPNDLMESIEPYDFSAAVDFQTSYLAGYLADKYDVTAEQSVDRANERIKRSVEDLFRETVTGYSSVGAASSSVRLENGTAKYALYPVWLLNTTYEGNRYTFAMNGQTGKFVGDLPADKKKQKKAIWLTLALSSLGFYGIFWLLHILSYFQ